MSLDLQRKAVVSQFITEIFERFSTEHLHALVTPDFRAHPSDAWSASEGLAGLEQFVTLLQANFHDSEAVAEEIIGAGGRVIARYRVDALRRNELPGFGSGSRRVRFRGTLEVRMEGGRIAEYWQNEDQVRLLVELGAVSQLGAQAFS